MQDDYKEFTGKNLDDAMAAACTFYGVERGKLEIEIINDAKTGIFGLVGAKRATVRARKANFENISLKIGENNKSEQKNGRKEAAPKQEKKPRPAPPAQVKEPQGDAEPASAEQTENAAAPKGEPRTRNQAKTNKKNGRKNTKPAEGEEGRSSRSAKQSNNKKRQQDQNKPKGKERPRQEAGDAESADAHDFSDLGEKLPEIPLESMDQELLSSTVLEAVTILTQPIVGDTEKELEIGSKVRVRIASGEDSGLLIGRDGQTLAALQYLVSCIASRKMGASVRVQIDAGDYRERQMEKLREHALELAKKVKENGRPQSTRPLSAFQRRAIHIALQDDPDVQTHSKGDGSLKRVIIVPKKK